jgi:hypothetical protein
MPYVFQETQEGEPRFASEIPSLTSEVLTETFAQTFEENPVAAMTRAYQLGNDYRTGEKISADVARQRLAERGMESDIKISDGGITQAALDTLMFRKGIERRRQEIYSQAEGGFAQGAARLGVGIATSLVDPVSVATAFIPVVGEARYLAWLGRAGGVVGRTGVRAGVGAIEGVAGAALIEPIIAGSRRYEQADYGMADSLLNVSFGGLFGAGLHSVGGAISDGVRHYRGTEPAWRGLENLTPDEAKLALNLRSEIERGMDVRDIGRVTDGWTPEMRKAVEPDVPKARAVTPAEAAHQALPPITRELALKQAIVQAVTGEQVDVAPIVERNQPEQIIGYTTAKGSTYEISENGTTTRDKARRPEHPGDSGPQPTSERTFYIAQEHAEVLGEFQSKGVGKRSIVVSPDGRAGVRYEEGPSAGKIERRTVVPISDKPSVGAIPVELWNGGQRAHFGNPITSVRTAQRVQSGQPAAGESAADVARFIHDAEKVLAREADTGTPTADALKNATEEADLAQSDLKALAERLGEEAEDAELTGILEAAANSERWARAAELATVCLVRGG